ncbi:germinal-center associated nuclear protein isoform X2 [Rhipicephalus sanguineus]|uniref:germinal-center associated nuclear protein isoform X2 n=1 Tax=Rhipicephalus sanguineus TaxID=34632 RepID=UPI001893FC26|nr:germinal-center associated nuclear protein isoform X2 [Rhipicephalus sanguineus]XP_037518633.1 germinal-center associated nuclear protein isoform X2 [Rhipicephalus sanguineus]
MSESTDDDPSSPASSFGSAGKLSPSSASQSTELGSRSPSSPIAICSSFGASPIQRGGNTPTGDVFDNADPCEKDVFGVSSRASTSLPTEKQRRIHGTRVTATPEEISKLSALLCNQVPAELNNRQVLSQHFSQFGRLEHVTCDLKRKFATIYFSDHHSAALAKKRGTTISKQFPPVQIFWCAKKWPSGGTSESTASSTREAPKQRVSKRSASRRGHSQPEPKQAATLHVKAKEAAVEVKTQAEESLSVLLRQSAHSVGERYRVLDARDKIIRLRMEKQSDLATARATRGTCPDMCPEKERYSRTDKKCLSSFEMLPGSDGVMDHTRMVKEYSRSSADQEEPLAHELRPPHVLRHTMDYLLVHLMDSAQPVGEWYDFIWNRTRAIRKDITQQHLCDQVCVALVEQCARFHIHCAAALCEQDMSTFDPKINNENLVKCLQTLKHFYYDLSLRGLHCPNEPEFRAYDVLLHLNEGDTIRQVQKLPARVRWSAEVKRAVAAFAALNSNNYVRFFRVAAQAPYLAACLLHRYFGQVRLRALQTFFKAFCQPNHSEEFSLEVLGRQLGFDSTSEVQLFAVNLGLRTSEQALVLDRASPPELMGALRVARSRLLVESKRTTSVGEVVNGGPLPPDPQEKYRPHDSFTLDGTLRPAAFDASDQVQKCWAECAVKEEEPEPQPEPEEKQQPAVCSDEVVEEALLVLVEDMVQQELEAVGEECVLGEVAELTAASLLEEETEQLSTATCTEEYLRAEEQRLQEKLLAKRQAREDEQQAQEQLVAEILREGLQNETEGICRGCHQEALGQWQSSQSELILASLLDEVPLEESSRVARDSLAEEWAQHEDKHRRAELFYRHSLMAAAFANWVEFCKREKRQRRARESFPAAPSMRCNLTDLKLHLPPKRARISCLSKGLEAMAVIGALTEKLERAPMDLDRLLASSSSSTTGDFPFKLVVCLPLARCLHSFKAQQTVSHVRSKLGCQLEDAQVESITSDSAFCVTVVQGGDFSSEGCDHMGRPWLLSGTSALLLVATDGEPKDQLEMRLAETLRDALRLQPAPCVCLLDLGDQAVIENVDLRGLLPPVWRMFSCSREVPPRTVLEEAVHWCSQSRAVPPSLRTSLLRDFIAEAFYRLVYDTIYRDLAQHSMHWQFPNHMIKMINCTLDHLAAVAASEQLLGLSVVAPEMKHSSYSPDWNEPQHLEALSKHVKSLKLAEVCGDTRDVDTLVNYVEQLCSKHRHLGCPKAAVLGSVSTTLKRHGEDDAQLSSTLPWFDILQECFCHLLIEFCFKGEELVVHYLPAELDQFNAWDTWVDITLGTTASQPSKHVASLQPVTPEPVSHFAGENQTPVAGKVDSEYVCQLEQMVAHQRSLSASLTSQLETMLPTPSNVSTPEQASQPLKRTASLQPVTPEPVSGEDKTALGGKVDSECMRQLELMVARQKSLSASFTSQLESMLTTPSDVAMPEQEDEKTNDAPCQRSTSTQSIEDMLAMLETRVQESRKTSAMFTNFITTVLKS